ncbi:MAG: TonB-dependent receptor [Verrucomicrobia bacterium]|nr:TonB-dependent receptor [Verrucomicrobiota bacterium]
MQKYCLLFILFILSLNSIAQEKRQKTAKSNQTIFALPTISGTVIDELGNPIPFANVVLYNSADSSLVKGTATDAQGIFQISAEIGHYFLQLSFLTSENYKTEALHLKEDLELKTIQLEPKAALLDEVEVTAKRSQMELKLDKRVFNIEKDLTNAGANAAEILDNIPSVQVDVEGNISLRGSENVRVLIDGKPSSITGSSTADVLRQFQGNMIDRVEVITNPSARYEAEGEVGIINIVLKKEKQKGFNGSIDAVVGVPDNYRLAYNFNFRTKSFNLFTSYGLAYRKSPGSSFLLQEYNDADTAYVYESNVDRERGGLSNNLRIGSDWFIDSKTTLTFAGIYTYSDEKNTTDLVYRDLLPSRELMREVSRLDVEDEIGENYETSINFVRTFSNDKHKLNIDLQWSIREDVERSNIEEFDFSSSDLLLQNSDNLEGSENLLIQADYTQPIRKEGLFEAGIRGTLREVENDFVVKESFNGGPFGVNNQFNNNFLYKEDIFAAYLMFGNKLHKFSYQLGLRAEHAEISTLLKRTQENNDWTFTNLFPSAFLSYEKNKETSYQVSYSRRINRPKFRHLMPFQTFSDRRNLWAGNTNLQPEFTDSYELGLLKYFPKGSLFSSVYYRHRTGVINRITVVNSAGFTVMQPVNLATEDNFGLEVSGSYRFNDKINLNANANFYQAFTKGSFDGESLDNEVFTWNGRAVIKIEVLPKTDFQTSFRYTAPQTRPQGRNKSIYSLDLSLGKDVMAGKGTLVVSVRDVLNTNRRRSIIDNGTLYSESNFQWRARQILLSFNYRIKQKKKSGPPSGMEGGGDF